MPRTEWLRCLLGLLLLSFCSCQQSTIHFYPYQRVIKIGDDPTWAVKAFNDSSWQEGAGIAGNKVFWVRFHIQLPEEYIGLVQHKGLRIISVGSYEAYWDGVYIGHNGQVGRSSTTEVPGTFLSHQLIPDSLAGPGEHILALRVSHFHGLSASTWQTFHLGEYHQLGRLGLVITAFMFILGGIFLLVGIYFILIYWDRNRDITRLMFGIICLLFFALLLMEFQKFYLTYTYPYHYIRLLIIGHLTLILSVATPWFFAVYFGLAKHWRWPTLFTLFLIGLFYGKLNDFDGVTQLMMTISLVTSILLVGTAWWHRNKESHIVLAALLLCYAIPGLIENWQFAAVMHNYDVSLFISFVVLVFTQLYLLVKRSQAQQLAYEATLLRSARLQNELLRKNIQPHFLMNTLTSLIDWVEESPKESVEFIEALAEEFSAFHAITEHTRIALPKALHLCKSHLKIMRYRKEVDYVWEEQNLDYNQEIPPGVLLTILENGITHSLPGEDGKVRFVLRYEKHGQPKGFGYQLRTYAKNRPGSAGLKTGTGFKYIKARLEESYGENWALNSGPTEDGWQTTITVNT